MTRSEQVAAMLALVPAPVTPERLVNLESWERESLSVRACGGQCSPEAWNELVWAVWARGAYGRQDAEKASSDRSGGSR